MRYAEVVLNKPLNSFHYRIPDELTAAAQIGVRVAVPFGARKEVGYLVGLTDRIDFDAAKIKPLSAVLDPQPLLSASLLELARRVARASACSWGEILAVCLHPGLREVKRRTTKPPSPLEGEGGGRRESGEPEDEGESSIDPSP